jgi:putative transposase
MLVYEYKLKATTAQCAAIDEAIRVAQFIRNKCLRLWMDARGVEGSITANDLQVHCSRLAHEFAFAARLNSQARQAAADHAWMAIDRFYANCRAKRPGKQDSLRFQRHCRSVDNEATGWKLDLGGRYLTFTDGCGIGRVKLIGSRDLPPFSPEQFKRVRLLRRADGDYAQVVIRAERRVAHVPTGHVVGIDVGLHAYVLDWEGRAVANPRFIHHVEQLARCRQRRLSRKSVHHQQGKQPKQNHTARRRAKHNKYPPAPAATPPVLRAAHSLSPALAPAQPRR